MSKPKIILVAGPTASGKSGLALEYARKANSVIINADAMQVYAGLPILSAQPGPEEQQEIPHALYGVLHSNEPSSAGKWLELVRRAISAAVDNHQTPILVGGTGLYFKALLGGLAHIPAIPEAVREEANRLYETLGEEKFRHELNLCDPESAERLARNDRQRLVRAYEVVRHTGKPLGFWHQNAGENYLKDFEIEPYLLTPPREALYANCDRRFKAMIAQGVVEEVKVFLERKLDPDLPVMKTLGLREITSYLNGEVTFPEAIAKAQQMTRNYAKRQLTWFRNQWSFIT